MRSAIAAVAIVTLVGCGRTWPETVTSAHVAAMPRGGSVDVLPLDLELWTEPGYAANVDALRGTAEASIMNAALAALSHHAYNIGAMIDWNGDYPGGTALAHRDLLATIGSLARYGTAEASIMNGQLPTPFLPARLGESTGADATLYIGGWGYIANHHDSTGDKVARGIAIGLVVVAIAVIVVAAVSALGKGGDQAASGVGSVAARAVVSVSREVAQVAAEVAIDAAIDAATQHPEWSRDPNLPHDGESQMFLEMTLVDNHSGRALWHAHQAFPANPASAEDVTRVASSLLASLPSS